MVYLLVGLGNPGAGYCGTRHNIGFDCIDKVARKYLVQSYSKKFNAEFTNIQLGTDKLVLLKPMTYMNNSGVSVSAALNFYKIPSGNVFVIHDDLDIECGKLKVKTGGGSGGHNGLNSIDQHIGPSYHRVRIGISKPPEKDLISDYVLHKFTARQQLAIDSLLNKIVKNIEVLLECGKDSFFAVLNNTR